MKDRDRSLWKIEIDKIKDWDRCDVREIDKIKVRDRSDEI